MRFTVSVSGTFQKKLEERVAKWAASKNIAARIQVPDELKWWAAQEFGVPGHPIDPVEAKLLAFPGEGGTELREHVDWPGIKPHHTIANSLDEIHSNAAQTVQGALADGAIDNPEELRAVIYEATEYAKTVIVDAMATDLPGTRPDNQAHPKQSGKLHGQTASSVFSQEATVVEVSE